MHTVPEPQVPRPPRAINRHIFLCYLHIFWLGRYAGDVNYRNLTVQPAKQSLTSHRLPLLQFAPGITPKSHISWDSLCCRLVLYRPRLSGSPTFTTQGTDLGLLGNPHLELTRRYNVQKIPSQPSCHIANAPVPYPCMSHGSSPVATNPGQEVVPRATPPTWL